MHPQSETDSQSVGHIICQKAEDLKSTLVVMGNHNKSSVAEFFMGSVSQYVTHHSKRPVLIVRGI
jgi:nucleotide-binding universal stress UspA family protein